MFIHEYPIFLRKHLLKIEMLENLRDYPRDIVNVFYQKYTNGILSGCDITIKDHDLIVEPGLVVYNHMVYVMKEAETIPYTPEDCLVYIKIKFLDTHKELEKSSHLSRLELDVTAANEKDEIEIGRFRLQRGSELRNDYVDFSDLDTKYDTLNRIYVPYANAEQSGVWPYMLQIFAKEAMRYRSLETIDTVFCMTVLKDNKPVAKELIITYLNARLRNDKTDYSNYEIYIDLLLILEEIKDGRSAHRKSADQERKIMFV